MLEFLGNIDRELFLIINGWNSPLFDQFFWWYSSKWIWIPFYALLLYFIIRDYRKASIIMIVAVALLITASDQSSVHLFKNMFERLRPCHEPLLDGLVHIVNGKCGGSYGFISSHASNSFAITSFLWVILDRKHFRLKIILLIWALLMIYSRIYLGVHYPMDVIAGAIWGTIIGLSLGLPSKSLAKKQISGIKSGKA